MFEQAEEVARARSNLGDDASGLHPGEAHRVELVEAPLGALGETLSGPGEFGDYSAVTIFAEAVLLFGQPVMRALTR